MSIDEMAEMGEKTKTFDPIYYMMTWVVQIPALFSTLRKRNHVRLCAWFAMPCSVERKNHI